MLTIINICIFFVAHIYLEFHYNYLILNIINVKYYTLFTTLFTLFSILFTHYFLPYLLHVNKSQYICVYTSTYLDSGEIGCHTWRKEI